ncbi:MAG: DUF5106 domain-containing protein [Bacteroidetes bacterium]|nr:DUF5106 domain-containing protein [Bacteroidota bacterium]
MRIFFIIGLVLLANIVLAQGGYKIDFKVKGWKDSSVYLGHPYGESNLIKDTAQVAADGSFSFQGKELLPQGIYFLARKHGTSNVKILDFVVGDDQRFSLQASGPDYISSMTVKGDDDNALFFKNFRYTIDKKKEVDPLISVLKDSASSADNKKAAREALTKINTDVIDYQKRLVATYPKTITARVIKSQIPIVAPQPPIKANGNTFQLTYYRQHFFDNFDLSDDALIRVPESGYQKKLKEYFDRLFIQQPDSITRAIEFVVNKAKGNRETYKYAVWSCMTMYWQPEIMGLDEVVVNLYDTYFKTGEMDFWVDARTKENVREYADKIRSSMIGRRGANLIMQDANLQPRSLYDIKSKYTILFIFKPDCGHCREETPKLVDFYLKNKTKYDLEVFAVATDTSMQSLRNFIKEFKTPWITVDGPRSYIKTHFMSLYHADTTPTIYVLDDKKIIIAKRLPVKQLDDFLSHQEKIKEYKKKSSK